MQIRICRAGGRGESEAAWNLLREMTQTRIGEEDLQFNEWGKPMAPKLLPQEFNLTHSGGWAACAVAAGPVGIDLEAIGCVRPAILQRCFLPWERELVHEAQDPAWMFTVLWTAREAIGKWNGRGITFPGREAEYRLGKNNDGSAVVILKGERKARIEFFQSGRVILAVCAAEKLFESCEGPKDCDKISIWK